jgi:hypothetical protein
LVSRIAVGGAGDERETSDEGKPLVGVGHEGVVESGKDLGNASGIDASEQGGLLAGEQIGLPGIDIGEPFPDRLECALLGAPGILLRFFDLGRSGVFKGLCRHTGEGMGNGRKRFWRIGGPEGFFGSLGSGDDLIEIDEHNRLLASATHQE